MQGQANFIYLRGITTRYRWCRLPSLSAVAELLGCTVSHLSKASMLAREEGRGGFYICGHKIEFENGREHRGK